MFCLQSLWRLASVRICASSYFSQRHRKPRGWGCQPAHHTEKSGTSSRKMWNFYSKQWLHERSECLCFMEVINDSVLCPFRPFKISSGVSSKQKKTLEIIQNKQNHIESNYRWRGFLYSLGEGSLNRKWNVYLRWLSTSTCSPVENCLLEVLFAHCANERISSDHVQVVLSWQNVCKPICRVLWNVSDRQTTSTSD